MSNGHQCCRLFQLYARDIPRDLEPADIDEVIDRTDGVTASSLKEVRRRSVLGALEENPGPVVISAQHGGLGSLSPVRGMRRGRPYG